MPRPNGLTLKGNALEIRVGVEPTSSGLQSEARPLYQRILERAWRVELRVLQLGRLLRAPCACSPACQHYTNSAVV